MVSPGQPIRLSVAALLCAALLLALGCGGGAGKPAQSTPTGAPAAPASVMTLASRTDLRPPRVFVDTMPENPPAGLIFVSPRMEDVARDGATHQQGALGVDALGRTVWFHAASDGAPITDVRVQRYQGKPVLTWWEGATSNQGIGRGQGVIVDSSYKRIATVAAGNGQTADLHEFLLTDRGTALLTVYSRARRDLDAMGGLKNAQVTQGIVQEVDVATGKVLFEWKSLDHVDPSESVRTPPTDPDESFDYFHINSVEEDADGDLLVSARNTSAIYKIDRDTGEVVWRLGGKKSDFDMGPGTDFGLQHDARWQGGDVVQLFDNGPEAEEGKPQEPSSVKRIALDEDAMTATLRARFDQPDGMYALSQGDGQTLADGRVMVGWGSTGAFTMFDRRGDVLFDASLPAEYDSYRAYTSRWVGRPATPPAVDVTREGEQVTVAASWNGSTEVRSWQVLAGDSATTLKPVGTPAEWRDLETTIVRATAAPYVAVAALDADGKTLSTSPAINAPMPPAEG